MPLVARRLLFAQTVEPLPQAPKAALEETSR